MTDKFYTVADIASLLSVTEKTIRDTINRGDIEAYKVGKYWRISQSAFDEYLKSNSNRNSTKG